MDLGQVRLKINSVDDDMKRLFDERMKCSNQVADIKIAEGDKVFKPLREKEIAERFAGDKEYLSFVKKVMQISRKRQYNIFIDNVDAISEELSELEATIINQGTLELELKSDETSTVGLNVNDILSVISDSNLTINKISLEEGLVKVQLKVDNEDKIREALVLAYMLREETL